MKFKVKIECDFPKCEAWQETWIEGQRQYVPGEFWGHHTDLYEFEKRDMELPEGWTYDPNRHLCPEHSK